ncbi:YdcF family protein [Candidatus Dojkabacteria bacterium]|uniref:YdcF family protein n=1 Tax=Candidatus Dojkabacteria bacterium TaxID=2099670 RepID=A0A955RII9_9BACT|nr:YdcF family protein [Candidatus Dojkabacteria bacterium]
MDAILVLGKAMYKTGIPDWILESRLSKCIEVLALYPDAQLILSGGKSHIIDSNSAKSEAEDMLNYLKGKFPDKIINRDIQLETESNSTIDQIIRLKLNFLSRNKFTKIALITDEIHMPRAFETIKHILGPDYSVEAHPAEVKIGGVWRKKIEEYERGNFEITKTTRFNKIKPGDHQEWSRLNKEFTSKPQAEKEAILSNKAPFPQ